MRRKMYTKGLRILLEEETYERLKKASQSLKISMSDIVRIAIRSHLKRIEEELYVSNVGG